jgi:hypothetical protein
VVSRFLCSAQLISFSKFLKGRCVSITIMSKEESLICVMSGNLIQDFNSLVFPECSVNSMTWFADF